MVFCLDMLQNSLNNTTAIGVNSECMGLASEHLYNEGDMLCRDSLDRFLNNVIAILILDKFKNIYLQLFNEFGLLVDQNMFKCLLRLVLIKDQKSRDIVNTLYSGNEEIEYRDASCLPFVQHGIHTSAKITLRYDSSYNCQEVFFVPDCRARTSSG